VPDEIDLNPENFTDEETPASVAGIPSPRVASVQRAPSLPIESDQDLDDGQVAMESEYHDQEMEDQILAQAMATSIEDDNRAAQPTARVLTETSTHLPDALVIGCSARPIRPNLDDEKLMTLWGCYRFTFTSTIIPVG